MVLVKIPNLNCLWFKKLVEFQEKKTHMVQWLISKTFSYILRRNFHGCSTLGYLTQICSDEIYSFFDSNFTDSHNLSNSKMEHYLQNNKQITISYLDRGTFTKMNNTEHQDNNS